MNEDLKKKNSNVKKIILGSFLGIMIGSLLGISYAMFTFNSTSVNNKLIAGDIYMRYKETTGLDISGAMPSTTYDNTKYFEFDIIGKNTSNRDVWYEIVLADGDKPNNRNTKLDDKFLKFTLYKGNEMVVNGVSYDDITNQRLYTGTIEKNTNTDTTTTYKLYMWIDNSVGIGTNTDYTMAEWNDIYAAVKVNVNARSETSSSCFTLSNKDDTNHTATISAYDATCGGTDIIIPKVIDGYTITTLSGFGGKGLTNVIMQEGVTTISQYAFAGGKFISIDIPNSVTTIGNNAFVSGYLTKIKLGNNVTTIGNETFYSNRLTSIEIPDSVTTIGNSAFQKNQLVDVIVGNGVQIISQGAFQENQISSLTLGNSVQTIGESGFLYNKLTSVEIPDSVMTIGNGAFLYNQLTNVIIGRGVQTIGTYAFAGPTATYSGTTYGPNQIASVTIPASVNSMPCSAFGNQGNGTITTQITYENPNFTCSN